MLTQDQINSFHASGFLIMSALIRGHELSMLQEAADRVIAEGIARIGEASHRYAKGPDGEEVYWRSEHMWERDPIFQAVTANPELLENIGQCIGKAFYPWNDSLVVKLPQRGAAVAWHQDPPYRNPDREFTYAVPNFTTDIYLDHSGPENGCVWAISGRHLQGHIDLTAFSEDELFARAHPLVMEAGDVLFHALSTPHGSKANTSNSIRRVFYIHYLAEEVYQDGYSTESWANEKPGWNPERRSLVNRMISSRQELGLGFPTDRAHLVSDEDGIKFIGTPSTPPRRWSHLSKIQ